MSTWRSGQYRSGFLAFSLFFLVAFLERSPQSWSWAAEAPAATMPKEPIYPKFLTGGTGKSSLLVFSCFSPGFALRVSPSHGAATVTVVQQMKHRRRLNLFGQRS